MSEYDYERPFNLMQWVADHAHELTPPVANKQVYADSRMIVMIVGGGNVRTENSFIVSRCNSNTAIATYLPCSTRSMRVRRTETVQIAAPSTRNQVEQSKLSKCLTPSS